MVFDDNDIQSAALCAWKEARGEGMEGMCGVLYVLKNRVGTPGFAKTLHDVIYEKNQFTSMSVPSDPEFNLKPADDDPMFAAALEMATRIFQESPTSAMDGDEIPTPPADPTRGARYYANLHNIDEDEWFYKNIVLDSFGHRVTAQIKHHTFFA